MTKSQNTKKEVPEQDKNCLSSSYTFTFGKHKGLSWEQVAAHHPNYIHWCIKNVPWFKIPEGCVVPKYKRRIIYIEDDDYWDYPGSEYDDPYFGVD